MSYDFVGGRNTATFRVVLSKIANLFVKEMLGISGILTVSSFFRLYQGSAIQQLQAHYGDRILERAGFECMVEMIIKMINLQLTISEVPMILDTSLQAGHSKMKIQKTVRGYFSLLRQMQAWKVSPGTLTPTPEDSHL